MMTGTDHTGTDHINQYLKVVDMAGKCFQLRRARCWGLPRRHILQGTNA